MAEVSDPEIAAPPPDAPAPPTAPRSAWRARARRGLGWFAAEFLVVVSGVLVALALNAWWASRQDRATEQAYLRQLIADTAENEARIGRAIHVDSVAGGATARALDALTGTGPLPPADSLRAWVLDAGHSSDFKPVAGTYDALIGTGDLRLLRDDTLRTRLTAYVGTLEAEAERLGQLRGAFWPAIGPFVRGFPFIRRVFLGDAEAVPFDVTRARDDPEAVVALFTFQAANQNRLSGLRHLRRETRALRAALEAQR